MVDQNKLAAETEAVFKSSRNDVDPVSGNDVPTGSLPEEVRDDIPAQLSEGEYVVPADVVRYYGVKFFEDLRGEAKMGWKSMEQNGRIGGEPMSPPGMEMGDDELPFDLSELNFVEVSDDAITGMAEGGFWAGLKRAFGADERPSTKEIMERRKQERQETSSRKQERQEKQERQDKPVSKDKSWGDASENKGYQDMAKSMRDTFGVNSPEGPSVLDTLKGYIPDMPNIDLEMGGNAFERAERRKAKGVGFADGGYALSEGDQGYEEKGALGLGAEGLKLGGEIDVRKYINDAGDVLYVPFIDEVAQIEIPEGYYLASEAPTEDAEKDTAVDSTSVEVPEEGINLSKPMQSVNFKEMSNDELAQIVKQQQGLTGNALAAAAGIVNPIMGLAVKLAMMDTAKRVKTELERRAADPSLSAEEKTKVSSLLDIAKKDQPSLIRRLFDKAVDKVEDVIDPTLSAEQKAMAEKVNQYNVPSGLGTESDTQKEERLMDQYVEAPTSKGVQPPSPVTVEELPPAPLAEPSSPLPTTITYDDLLMGRESPVTKTLTLDEIISNAQNALGKAENAISKVANAGKTAVEKGMEAGKEFDLEATISRLEEDPLFFLKTIAPQAYTPNPTVPRVATPKSTVAKESQSLGAPTVSKDTIDWSSVRNEAKKKSTQAIVNARNNLATEQEISDMSAAAKRVDDYLKAKATGKPTGTYGFAEGGSVEGQYTGLDALKDMQKINQYS